MVDVLVRVLQRNRINKMYTDTHKRRYVIGMGLCGYGGQEVHYLPSARREPGKPVV